MGRPGGQPTLQALARLLGAFWVYNSFTRASGRRAMAQARSLPGFFGLARAYSHAEELKVAGGEAAHTMLTRIADAVKERGELKPRARQRPH